MLPLVPRPGLHWTQDHHIFATPEGGGGELHWTGEVRALASLTVPAGTFRDALEVRSTYHGEPGAGSRAFVHLDSFVRGVGLVRSVSFPEDDPEEKVEQQLLSYRIPGAEDAAR
jgi:hypothetical protein